MNGDRTMAECGRSDLNLHSQDSTYRPGRFYIIDEAKYNEYRSLNLSDEEIFRKDLKKKEKIDSILSNFRLPENDQPVQRSKGRHSRINVVLIGKTGSGKSATGNTLLGERAFVESNRATSTSVGVRAHECSFNGSTIRVVDTPGFIDTARSPDELAWEVAKVFSVCSEGVHVFLYVQKATDYRFTKEQEDVKRSVLEAFGERILHHTAMVLTHADTVFTRTSLGTHIKASISGTPLGSLIEEDLEGRIIAVENDCTANYKRDRIRESLMNIIFEVLHRNKSQVYDHEWFQHASLDRFLFRDTAFATPKSEEHEKLQRCLRVAREVGHELITEHLSSRTIYDVELELYNSYIHAIPMLTRNLRLILHQQQPGIHDVLHSLTLEEHNPFRDVIEALINPCTYSHLYKLALEKNDVHFKTHKANSQVQDCIHQAVSENRGAVIEKFEKQGNGANLVDSKVFNVIAQRVGELGESSTSLSTLDIRKEISQQLSALCSELYYANLIEKYNKELDSVIWQTLQLYVKDFTPDQLHHIDDQHHWKICDKALEALSPGARIYFVDSLIIDEIKRQMEIKEALLEHISNSLSAKMRRFVGHTCVIL